MLCGLLDFHWFFKWQDGYHIFLLDRVPVYFRQVSHNVHICFYISGVDLPPFYLDPDQAFFPQCWPVFHVFPNANFDPHHCLVLRSQIFIVSMVLSACGREAGERGQGNWRQCQWRCGGQRQWFWCVHNRLSASDWGHQCGREYGCGRPPVRLIHPKSIIKSTQSTWMNVWIWEASCPIDSSTVHHQHNQHGWMFGYGRPPIRLIHPQSIINQSTWINVCIHYPHSTVWYGVHYAACRTLAKFAVLTSCNIIIPGL